jgi:hypothetical protein
MTTAPGPKHMPALPRPGQKVRWRNRPHARACGWEDFFGPGPYEVVGVVDRSDLGLAANVVVRTNIGEREVPEVWLALADEPAMPGRPAPPCRRSRPLPARPASGAGGPARREEVAP